MKNPLIFIAAILFFAFYSNASACSCTNPPTIEKSFADSDAVLYGFVTYAQEFENQVLAVVEVKKAWKGLKKDKIIVKTGLTSCDIDFKMDQPYYLWLNGDGDRFETVPCRQHAGAEESFLSDKPTLSLETVALELGSVDKVPPPAVDKTQRQAKREKDSGQPNLFRGVSPVMITSVITTLLVLLIVGIGFWLWQKRAGK